MRNIFKDRLKEKQKTLTYELQPYSYTWVLKEDNEMLDVQTHTKELESIKIIINKNTTIVLLEDGTKGIAKLNPSDTFDINKGIQIACHRAKIKQIEKELKQLIK